ncbi:MAG: threonine/serine exporter family protein [Eubacteriales bacterium]|nr:threonine/serine exporter family protein [Eubacteriales bacterium]
MEIIRHFLTACIASSAYGMIFDLRGKALIFGAIGGGAGWVIYNSLLNSLGYSMAFFLAAVFVGLYAEIMARVKKLPASVFILVGMLPLVPGEGIYLTMKALVTNDSEALAHYGRLTFNSAGVLALGLLLVSSIARFISQIRLRKKN